MADEAKTLGLVTFVVVDEELDEYIRNYAKKLASGPKEVIQMIKRAVYQSQTMSLRASLDLISSQMGIVTELPNFKEGVQAVVEKRVSTV